MDFSNAVAHGGLSAKGTATGQGITWRPRVGSAAASTALPGVDSAASFTVAFPEATGRLDLDLTQLGAGALQPAIDTLVVTGVTGASAAALNVTYTRSATLYNFAPQWVNGNATIRLATNGQWEIILSAVIQFESSDHFLSPALAGSLWDTAGGEGSPSVVIGATGDSPTSLMDVAAGGTDPEGNPQAPIDHLRGVEILVLAGSVLIATGDAGRDPIPLPTGGRALLSLPADIPAGLVSFFMFQASEPGTEIQVTGLGVLA